MIAFKRTLSYSLHFLQYLLQRLFVLVTFTLYEKLAPSLSPPTLCYTLAAASGVWLPHTHLIDLDTYSGIKLTVTHSNYYLP